MTAKRKTYNNKRHAEIPQLLAKIADRRMRATIADDVGCDPHYLYLLATGRRRASEEMATTIARRVRIPRAAFRPDLFAS